MIPFLLAAQLLPLATAPTTADGRAEFFQPIEITAPLAPPPNELAQAVDPDSGAVLSEPEQPINYFYGSLQLGAAFPENWDGDFRIFDESSQTTLDLNGGFNGELALGYKFSDFRTDLSVGYSNLPVNNQSFSIGNLSRFSESSQGSLNLFTVMLNAYYDVPIRDSKGTLSRWSPYIGAGIGYGNLDAPSCSTSECFRGGSAGAFAYQGKVGVSYRATQSGFAFLEAGYLGTSGVTIDNVDFDNFNSWRVNLGWRQRFGGAPKAKVVAVPPAPVMVPVPIQQIPEPAPVLEPAPVRGLW